MAIVIRKQEGMESLNKYNGVRDDEKEKK